MGTISRKATDTSEKHQQTKSHTKVRWLFHEIAKISLFFAPSLRTDVKNYNTFTQGSRKLFVKFPVYDLYFRCNDQLLNSIACSFSTGKILCVEHLDFNAKPISFSDL